MKVTFEADDEEGIQILKDFGKEFIGEEEEPETYGIVLDAMRDYIADMTLAKADPKEIEVAVGMSRTVIQAVKANRHR